MASHQNLHCLHRSKCLAKEIKKEKKMQSLKTNNWPPQKMIPLKLKVQFGL